MTSRIRRWVSINDSGAPEPGHNRRDATGRTCTRVVPQASSHARRHGEAALPRRSASSSGGNGTRAPAAGVRTSGTRGAGRRARARSCDKPAEGTAQASDHVRRGFSAVGRSYQHVHRTEILPLQSECLADAALEAVTHHGLRRVLARNQHAEPRAARVPSCNIKRVAVDAAPGAVAQQALEFGLLPQPARRIQPEALVGRGYSPRRRRPRARRLRSTLRPPTVRLRTRKPWRRARRTLEG